MSLRARFNLALLVLFVLVTAIAGALTYRLVYDDAKRALARSAGVMIESASAIRRYTFEQLRPPLAPLLAETFPPQIVPAYAAAQAMQVLRQKLPGYTYKEATYNATNPADEAVGWEVGLIQDLRRLGPGAEVVLDRYDEQGEPQLIVARPIRIEQQECLVCHSEPSAAPRSMIKVYGAARGFGWPLDQVIGADIVGAPLAVARGAAMHALRSLAWVLAGILVALLLGLNLMFDRIVVSPLARLAKLANDASLGKAADFSGFSGRGDEIGSLAGAFTRTMSGLRRAIGLIDRDGGPKTRDERGR